MSRWDDDGPQLDANLARILAYASADARSRTRPTLNDALKWHKDLMHGLVIPPEDCAGFAPENVVGRFRGTPGLEGYDVEVGGYNGVPADRVPAALKDFEAKLQSEVALLDAQFGPELTEQDLSLKQTKDIISLCAWAHAEWIRIHPFANGNGRTARLWANYLAQRYALPPFVQLRPRPGRDYAVVCALAMRGFLKETYNVFVDMYMEYKK